MASELGISNTNARFLWCCCSMRLWKQVQQRSRKKYYSWACSVPACLNTLQVPWFGSWHYSPVLFEVFLSLATASNPSLLHNARALGSVAKTTVYSKFRGSVVLSNILHKLKQTNSKKIRTKEVITSAYFSKPSADTHTLCKSYSFQYIFS